MIEQHVPVFCEEEESAPVESLEIVAILPVFFVDMEGSVVFGVEANESFVIFVQEEEAIIIFVDSYGPSGPSAAFVSENRLHFGEIVVFCENLFVLVIVDIVFPSGVGNVSVISY